MGSCEISCLLWHMAFKENVVQNARGSGKAGITKVQLSTHICLEKAKEMGMVSTFHRVSSQSGSSL